LGFTVPFRVADEEVTDVAASVVTVGAAVVRPTASETGLEGVPEGPFLTTTL
jgi:hypothetical protein